MTSPACCPAWTIWLKRFETDQAAFLKRAIDPERPFIGIKEAHGLDAAADVVRDLANGVSDPAIGHVIRL